MAKRKSQTPVFIDKSKFLLPKMEWHTVDEATGEGFFVRELNGQTLLEFKELALKSEAKTLEESLDLLAWLTAHGACDARGLPIFTDEDIPLLLDKPSVILEVGVKVLVLSGIHKKDEDELKNAQSSSTTELPTN